MPQFQRINLNHQARVIAQREGLKKALTIAQIKEVQALVLEHCWDLIQDEGLAGHLAVLDAMQRSGKSRHGNR